MKRARRIDGSPLTFPDDDSLFILHPSSFILTARWKVTKYLVQWDKDDGFGRSYAGGDVSHADAARWSVVVEDTRYQAWLTGNQVAIVALEWHSTPCLTRRKKEHLLTPPEYKGVLFGKHVKIRHGILGV